MIGCLRTRVRKQPIIALYSESETVLRFYNLEARLSYTHPFNLSRLSFLNIFLVDTVRKFDQYLLPIGVAFNAL